MSAASTRKTSMTISEMKVDVVRKNIKNLHLSVYPPDGQVRVAAPNRFTDDNVRLAVVSRLAWIKKQQAGFAKQPRQSRRNYVSGESHYFKGKRYLMEVIERHGKHELVLKGNKKMILYVRPGTTRNNRALVVNNWYRQHLKKNIPALLEKWQPVIGKQAANWQVRKMKTKWGSCNISARRILINLELAKKSARCLEYIIVHELVHLHERLHNEQFKQLMDQFMPNWRMSRDILKSQPLAHERWRY